jgi:hypothetical protein
LLDPDWPKVQAALSGGRSTGMSREVAITNALGAHGLWVARFRRVIAGQEKVEAAIVGRDDQCEFGKWMQADGQKHLDAASFKELRQLHQEFHRVAGALVQRVDAGDLASAKRSMELGGDFNKASAVLAQALMKAKSKAA